MCKLKINPQLPLLQTKPNCHSGLAQLTAELYPKTPAEKLETTIKIITLILTERTRCDPYCPSLVLSLGVGGRPGWRHHPTLDNSENPCTSNILKILS